MISCSLSPSVICFVCQSHFSSFPTGQRKTHFEVNLNELTNCFSYNTRQRSQDQNISLLEYVSVCTSQIFTVLVVNKLKITSTVHEGRTGDIHEIRQRVCCFFLVKYWIVLSFMLTKNTGKFRQKHVTNLTESLSLFNKTPTENKWIHKISLRRNPDVEFKTF